MDTPLDEQGDDPIGQLIAHLVQQGATETSARICVHCAFHLGMDAGRSESWMRGVIAGLLVALFWSAVAWLVLR